MGSKFKLLSCGNARKLGIFWDNHLIFKENKKELVFQLKSGVSLFLTGAFLSAELKGRSAPIVKLSKACRERLQTLYERGYVPYSASVRFIVAWKGKDDAEETAVVLPEISLRKRKSTANKGWRRLLFPLNVTIVEGNIPLYSSIRKTQGYAPVKAHTLVVVNPLHGNCHNSYFVEPVLWTASGKWRAFFIGSIRQNGGVLTTIFSSRL